MALAYVRAAAPGLDWLVAFLFGAAYLVASTHFARLDRRPLYLLSATIGLVLLALAAPLYLGLESRWLPLFWLFEIELILASGVFLRERYFRVLAYLGFVLVFLDVVLVSEVIAAEFRIAHMVAGTVLSLGNVYLLSRTHQFTRHR